MRPMMGMAAVLLLSAGSARAQSSESAAMPEIGSASDSLPGVVRVAAPTRLEGGVSISMSAGYGFFESIVEADDVHHRGTGTVAISYRALDWLGVGLKLEGRVDRHELESSSNQSFITDPRLFARVTTTAGERLSLGAQLVGWFPGDGGELELSAATFDVVGLSSYRVSPELVIAANAGFRLDRSDESVGDESILSNSDRLVLGVSDSSAVLLGFGAVRSAGPFELVAEWTFDALIGSDAPSLLDSPMRISGGARYHATPTAQLDVRVDVSPSGRPAIGADEPFVPVEPRIGLMLGISVRFPTASETPAR